jgi:16S rRNA (guanine(966)-N(2))-methyltransferase RsmD
VRITGGSLKGRRVPSPDVAGVRPTSSRVREALFSMVGQDLDGWSVLDACGGTGLLAFEALSRGAGPVEVVERRPAVARRIGQAARALGVVVRVRVGDAGRALGEGRWDLVLLDPPYADEAGPWVERALGAVGRVLVVEHRRGASLPAEAGRLVLDRQRTYGDTGLALYRPRP